VDSKTLVGLLVGVALLVASFFLGKSSVKTPPLIADTVIVHNYSSVETSFNIDTVQAYLKLKKNNAILKSENIRLQIYSDSLNDFIEFPDVIVASLDTTLIDSSTLSILYFFPPQNTFLINYLAKPIINSIDSIFIKQKETEYIKQDGLWLHGLLGYGSGNVGIGASVGYSWGGIGIILAGQQQPIYTVNFHHNF